MNKYSYCVIFLIIFAVSCNRKVAPLTSSLQTEGMHHKWKVTTMQGVSEPLPYIFIDLRDINNTKGFAGCDSLTFTPKYWYNHRVDFMHVSPSYAACKGSTMTDKIFAENLSQVYYYKLNADKLLLFDKNNKAILEAIIDPSDENGSISRTWVINKMINAQQTELVKAHSYLDFTDLNRSTAKVGCNVFSFPVTLSGNYFITIGQATTTRMFCKNAAINEEVLSKTLKIVNMYQVVGNTLRLFDKENVLLLEATAPLQ